MAAPDSQPLLQLDEAALALEEREVSRLDPSLRTATWMA